MMVTSVTRRYVCQLADRSFATRCIFKAAGIIFDHQHCENFGSHSDADENSSLLRYGAVYIGMQLWWSSFYLDVIPSTSNMGRTPLRHEDNLSSQTVSKPADPHRMVTSNRNVRNKSNIKVRTVGYVPTKAIKIVWGRQLLLSAVC